MVDGVVVRREREGGKRCSRLGTASSFGRSTCFSLVGGRESELCAEVVGVSRRFGRSGFANRMDIVIDHRVDDERVDITRRQRQASIRDEISL